MITKKYAVFSLEPSVCGFSNSGIERDDYCFTMFIQKTFENKEDAERFIIERMKDYKIRKVGENTRFTIQEVFFYSGDIVFD